jgi:uncharacterized protein
MLLDEWFLAYAALGGLAGFLAGLFGIGGGGLMVPILTLLFSAQGFPEEHQVHLALGTSMAAIIPSSLASLRSHHAKQAVLWPVVVRMTPGVLIGTFAATFLASSISSVGLAIFFAAFMTLVSVQMFLDRKPTPARLLPSSLGLASVGTGIGGVSALVAVGGGTMTLPFLTWCNVALPTAIGTSAALGLPIALAGAFGYATNGWSLAQLPAYCIGYIYLPAWLCMACTSIFLAPLGVQYAHQWPVKTLKKLIGILTLSLAADMLYTVLV